MHELQLQALKGTGFGHIISLTGWAKTNCICYRSQKAILQDLQKDIPKSFDFIISENNFEVISGKQEGVYAWIAANYALQKFGHGDEDKCKYKAQFGGSLQPLTPPIWYGSAIYC